jgi:electron transfer flavoprotein beta subunit
MKARKKPMDVRNADDLGLDLSPRLTVIKVSEPPARRRGIRVASAAELVDRLRNEAGVL